MGYTFIFVNKHLSSWPLLGRYYELVDRKINFMRGFYGSTVSIYSFVIRIKEEMKTQDISAMLKKYLIELVVRIKALKTVV